MGTSCWSRAAEVTRCSYTDTSSDTDLVNTAVGYARSTQLLAYKTVRCASSHIDLAYPAAWYPEVLYHRGFIHFMFILSS